MSIIKAIFTTLFAALALQITLSMLTEGKSIEDLIITAFALQIAYTTIIHIKLK